MEDRLSEIEKIVSELIAGTDCFIVATKSLPTNNFKFFIDSDSGFGIDQAISINRKLRNRIEEMGWYPEGEYSLEVSSPGVDMPLVSTRQLIKNLNRLVKLDFLDKEMKSIEGRLISVEDNMLKLSIKHKKDIEEKEFMRNEIKDIIVQIEF
jgi:ribosome maturation factor RimP